MTITPKAIIKNPLNKCCIVIPLYKSIPDVEEEASLNQILKTLHGYKVIFIGAENFDASYYVNIAKGFKGVSYEIKSFPAKYFNSSIGYSRLLMSLKLYFRFIRYEYILIYQLDAWVFKDDLNYWCSMKYDYIGAPWFENFSLATEQDQFLGVGNGGFSLRRVDAHVKALLFFKYLSPILRVIMSIIPKSKFKDNLLSNLQTILSRIKWTSIESIGLEEDYFFCKVIAHQYSWYKIPSPLIAMKFSMEVNPQLLYKYNNDNLPFGCHAWNRYDPKFWRSFISI